VPEVVIEKQKDSAAGVPMLLSTVSRTVVPSGARRSTTTSVPPFRSGSSSALMKSVEPAVAKTE
jgi:hypothetical protein